MGIVRPFPRLEAWLDDHATSWEGLSDASYQRVVAEWTGVFRSEKGAGPRKLRARRALAAFAEVLPADVFLFSGVRIPEVANLGARGAAGYRAVELDELNLQMACALELVVAATDFAWCLPLSHESGGWVHEEFWLARR